jgi:fucose permease
MLLLSVMLMGVGGGFSEALLNPLIIDIHPRQSGRYLNLGHAFYPISVMGSALLFGELLTRAVSWRLIFQLAAIAALLVAIFTTALRFPHETPDDTAYIKRYTRVLKMGGFWLFAAAMFLAASIESALTFWSRSYVEIYLSDVPLAGAIAVVIFAASMAVGRFLSAYLSNHLDLNTMMIGSAILGLAVGGLLPFAASLTLFYFLVGLAGLAVACFWPTILAEAGSLLVANSTILMILLACAGIFGIGLTPWIMGLIGDSRELRSGFILIPLLFLLLGLLLIVERRWRAIITKEKVAA